MTDNQPTPEAAPGTCAAAPLNVPLVAEMETEERDIQAAGFLRDAQRTLNLKVAIERKPVIEDFNGLFASFGSCFAQNLQKTLTSYGFPFWFERDICAHYSSESMANALAWVADGAPHTFDELFYYNDARGGLVAYRYLFKKRFFGKAGEDRVFARMAEVDAQCAQAIRQCQYLVLTLGNSRVIRFKGTDDLINGAFGIPQEHWRSEVLSVEANVAQLERMYDSICRIRSGVPPTIFLSISPQRYLFPEDIEAPKKISPYLDNMLGKSILRVAVGEFLDRHPDYPVHYFPAYEIVMEELRQYETLSTYDFMHINQDLTPKYVVKRFLHAYAFDRILNWLPMIERVRLLGEQKANLLAGGLDVAEDGLFADQVLSLLDALQKLGGMDKAPGSLVLPLVELLRGCKGVSIGV